MSQTTDPATDLSNKELVLLPKYQGTTAELCWQEPENARKKYTVEGIGNFQGRHYRVNGQPYLSVTKILDLTMPKPALVPWARNVALEAVRETLLERLSLMSFPDAEVPQSHEEWADIIIEAARNRPDAIRDEAADWGTGAHKMLQYCIDLLIRDTGLSRDEIWTVADKFQPTSDAFQAFQKECEIQWLATELVLWNDDLKVAGTVDAVGRTSEGLVVFDWKTGRALYPEATLQVSAYSRMVEELYGEPVARAYAVRFPREQPTVDCPEQDHRDWSKEICCNGTGQVPDPDAPLFEVKEVASIEDGWEGFKRCVAQAAWSKTKPWRAQ